MIHIMSQDRSLCGKSMEELNRTDPSGFTVGLLVINRGQSELEIRRELDSIALRSDCPDCRQKYLNPTRVTKDEFLNRVRSLYNIDGYLLPEFSEAHQLDFIRDPPRYFINTDRVQSDAIWREIEKRQQT